MNPASPEPRGWSPARRWSLIALVFTLHLGLIFALGARKPAPPRPPAPAPLLSLAPDSNELLALNDPTLFARPHPQGFARAAWLKIPNVQFQPFRWTELPRLLPLRIEELGVAFAQFIQTNVFVSPALETKAAPELPQPVALETGVAPPTRSTLRVAGDLANRRLLNPPELPSWNAADLLTNTVVQVLVNADGNVFSPTLLSRSFDPKGDQRALKIAGEADQRALDVARASRFDAGRGASPALTLGVLIFEWHTEPLTNTPSSNP